MNRRSVLRAMAASGAVVVAGCSSGGGGGGGDDDQADETTTTTTKPGAATTVTAVNTSFDPIRLSVQPGATVTWENEDTYPHTITSVQFHETAAKWSFDKRVGGSGGFTEHTFEEAGVYEYYCEIHGKTKMCGAILVGDVSLDKQLPCEGGSG